MRLSTKNIDQVSVMHYKELLLFVYGRSQNFNHLRPLFKDIDDYKVSETWLTLYRTC